MVAGCCALMIIMNLVMWHFGKQSEFRYATVGFSTTMLTSQMNLALIVAVIFASIVFADELKNRTINNSIAFGLSKVKFLFGKLFVTVIVSLAGMIVVETALVGSAYLLLQDNGVNAFRAILRADLACATCFIAAICVYYAFVFLLNSEINAIWAWLVTVIGSSIVTELLGMKIPFFAKLHGWMIYSLVTASIENEQTGSYMMIWEQPGGLIKIVLGGAIWAVIALALGMIRLIKKA